MRPRALVAFLALPLLTACGAAQVGTRTVSLRLTGKPIHAMVTIDDHPVGVLGFVAERGVALPPGQHRITVEADGHFPWDRLVDARDVPVILEVTLEKVPQ